MSITITNTKHKSSLISDVVINSINSDSIKDWKTSVSILSGEVRNFSGSSYISTKSGLSGNIPPTHLSGNISDGNIQWIYLGKEKNNSSIYFGIGDVSETIPTEAIDDSSSTRNIITDKIISLIRASADIRLYFQKTIWNSGIIYDSSELAIKVNANIVISNRLVYSCIYSPGTVSTIEPTVKSIFEYSDGYIWEFLYEIQDVSDTLFQDFIPISETVSSTLTDNPIKFVRVLTGGSNYDPGTNLQFSFGNATIQPVISGGGIITSVTVIDSGSGYSTVPTINITSAGSGVGATFEVITSSHNTMESLTNANTIRLFATVIEDENTIFPTSTNFEISLLKNVSDNSGEISNRKTLFGPSHVNFGNIPSFQRSREELISLVMLDDANKLIHSDTDITNLNFFITF